jgi:polyisoprenoid-binding protein YceI
MLKRMGVALTVLIAALALAAAGCGGDDEEPAAEPTTTAESEAPITVDLSEQNGSGQSGTATLESMDGGMTHVTIELSSPPADPQPAHIHSGTCAELGDVVYPLTNVEGGSSETDVAAPLEDLQGADFAINVHMSEADIGNYVACGDIPKS